ncbi:hypothetical protein JHK82_047781 [Glycine max]|nr:hypothetical protein JHK82_047781 [Glycine max]
MLRDDELRSILERVESEKDSETFTRLVKLDLVQSISRSFYLGVTDSNLAVIGTAFTCFYGTNSEGVVEVGNSIWVKGG